jgi:hypothetical protein
MRRFSKMRSGRAIDAQERRRLRGLSMPTWYLKLEEEEEGVRRDSGPFANDFTQNGVVALAGGKIGYGAFFPGEEGHYLSLADNPTVKLGHTFTLTGWFFLNSKATDMALCSKYMSSDFSFDLIVTYQVADDPEAYGGEWTKNEVNPDRIRVHLNGQTVAESQDFMTVFYANAFGAPPVETWLFFALRVRPNHMEMSINNSGWDSLALPDSAGMNGVAPMILGANEGGSLPLHGCLDEWAKFPRFLSDYQIARIYNEGRGKTLPL